MEENTVSIFNPKSILHYWLDISQDLGLDYIRLLDYLSERDLGLLDIALSERSIRQLYDFPLKTYYFTHIITIAKLKLSKSHLDWIVKRDLDLYIQRLEVSFNYSKVINFDKYDTILDNLKSIKLWFINVKVCHMLNSCCPNLQQLEILHGIDKLSNKSFKLICSECYQLTHIHIAEKIENSAFLPSRILSYISKYCKQLQVLKLEKLHGIDPPLIACLSNLTQLQMLNIDFLGSDGSAFPIEIFASNSELITFCLNGHFQHDPIMRGLGEHCHSLKYVILSVFFLEILTDDGIIAMVRGCPLLKTIYISASNTTDDFETTVSVTNAAMYAIAQYCRHLEYFRIISIVPLAYDNDGLDAIKHGCPHLRAIHKGMELYYASPTP